MPRDSEESQKSVASSFLVNIIEEEVPIEPSRDLVILQRLKAEFMYEVTPQRRRTLKEIIDLGINRYIYEETFQENYGKPNPGCNSEVAGILHMYPDKWIYRNIYEQTLWNECHSPRNERGHVSLQSLKSKFIYQVISQRKRIVEEIIGRGMHRYIYEETFWQNDRKPDLGGHSEVAKILGKYPHKWVYQYIYEKTLWNECRSPKSERISKVVCLNHPLFSKRWMSSYNNALKT
ncbi:hypothetical protein LIER_26844 [Lithospermum erythrorhizon]|uniref:Uncharacterized protein n=1 Tax=Lithospermum erythrorhizon TaxID=34254 RepID=A0AAV3RD28_LITER